MDIYNTIILHYAQKILFHSQIIWIKRLKTQDNFNSSHFNSTISLLQLSENFTHAPFWFLLKINQNPDSFPQLKQRRCRKTHFCSWHKVSPGNKYISSEQVQFSSFISKIYSKNSNPHLHLFFLVLLQRLDWSYKFFFYVLAAEGDSYKVNLFVFSLGLQK